jgi:hypothetical protein
MSKAHGVSDFFFGNQNCVVYHFLAEWESHGSRLEISRCTVRKCRVDRSVDGLAHGQAEMHGWRLDGEDADDLDSRSGSLEPGSHSAN